MEEFDVEEDVVDEFAFRVVHQHLLRLRARDRVRVAVLQGDEKEEERGGREGKGRGGREGEEGSYLHESKVG